MNKITKIFLMVIGLLVITDSYAVEGDCVNGQGTKTWSNIGK